jgi:signal transduction histidine kinase
MNATTTLSAPAGAERTAELLEEVPILAALPRTLLDEVAGHARRLHVPAGGLVMQEGSAGDGLYLLLDGEVEVTRRCGDRDVVLAVFGSGAVLGEMSMVERNPRSASVRALRDSEILVVEPEDFEKVLERSPATSLALLRTVLARLRSTEASLVQHAKLASLGTLAAGLAHELNNPAAALRRGLPQLQATLLELDRCATRLGALGLRGTVESRLKRAGADAPEPPPGAPPTGLDRVDAEDRLLDWLEERGIDHGVHVAPPLLEAGWTPERLRTLLEGIDEAHASPLLHWLAARCAATILLGELSRSAGAISEVVSAVRAHSALGQSAVRETDVVHGIESALVVLRGRLRDGVTVVRDFEPDLPRIEAHGAELNHVWANLVENAVDAMQGRGTLELRARTTPGGVTVQVIDDGPGVADDVRPRIFDPFYTTKPLGKGTGLGLHIVYNTVRRHGGATHVASRPGRTVFTVTLPLRLRGEP